MGNVRILQAEACRGESVKITYNWLKDYVDIKLSPEKLAHSLTMAGSEVKAIEKKAGDYVFEIEITPNRADCLSVVGIAREVAAITGKKLKMRKSTVHGPQSTAGVSIEIKDKKLCPRYSGRVIEDIKVGPAPTWMQERLKFMDLRPVNNIVDITNYCLFETGQPMHAFDLAKIRGAKIIVRRAEKGEKITTIDGVERELSPDMLIIADAQRPVAIAGVMGGLDTEVGPSTKNILLESAYFDPVSVRRTSRKLGLRSESSYRFERSVDLEAIADASNRAAVLISSFAGGKACVLVDKGAKKLKATKSISFDVKKASGFLGVNINAAKTKSIFKSLDLKASGSKNLLKVKVPSFRPDLNREVDLVEELARIYGYDNIPTTIPEMVPQPKRKDFSRIVQEKIRQMLIAGGLTEVVTYSLISKDSLKKFSKIEKETIDIVNPLSAEQEAMRPTILIGALGAILWNLNRKVENLKIFEQGNIYFKEGKGHKETLNLAILLTGNVVDTWRNKRKADFFGIKGIVETLLNRLGVEGIEFAAQRLPYYSPQESADVKIGGETVGVAGKVKTDILNNFDIKQDVYAAELDVDKLLSHAKLDKYFEPLPRYPSVKRDISVLLDRRVPSNKIIAAIKALGIQSIARVEVFDEYHGKQVPEDKKSLSFSILYRDKARTLTDQEVEEIHSRVKEALTSQFSAQFR